MSDRETRDVLNLILETQKNLLAEVRAIRELLANELAQRSEGKEKSREALKNTGFIRITQKET